MKSQSEEYCLFCDIENKKENRIIYENKLFYARWDNFPLDKGHLEVVPKRHVISFFDLNEKEVIQMFNLLKKLRHFLDERYHPDGYNIGVNDGKAAGRKIHHLHMHIIPRGKDNPIIPYYKDNTKEKIIIFENELFYAQWDDFPLDKGHSEVVLKRHVISFFDLNEKEVIQMFNLLKKLKHFLDEKYHPDGYNIGVNDGKVDGRRIRHLYIHIIPRYFSDSKEEPWGTMETLKKGKLFRQF